MAEQFTSITEAFQRALQERSGDFFKLRLYVAGNSLRSTTAILNLKRICEYYLKDRYQLEVIDIHQQPELARADQVVATPTLVKLLPEPVRLLVGDLSKTERVLSGLSQIPENGSGEE